MRGSFIFVIPIVGILSSCAKDTTVDQASSQFTQDTVGIAAYLKQNNIAATKLPQGVWFIIDSAAEGIRPTFYDSVKIKYTSRLLANKAILSQSTAAKHFVLDSLLEGIQFGLPEFQAGSKGRIFIPSLYSGSGNLIFEFQLTEVKDYQLKLDTTAIDTYLKMNSISAWDDISGLRYTIDAPGVGSKPQLTDDVLVNYTAKNFSDGSILDQGTSVSFNLSSLLLGWQIGLQKMQEGTTCTFYVPSSLGYGPYGNGTLIKANANLIFNVTLLKVTHP